MDMLMSAAQRLVAAAASATAGAPNEASLRQELENSLREGSAALGIPWTPFRLDLTLRSSSRAVFADVAHGAVIIEYEPPGAFHGTEGAVLTHARKQAEEYGVLLAREEGRELGQYVLVAWDGEHISFGRFSNGSAGWERLAPFDQSSAERLLRDLQVDGVPLIHPLLLTAIAGPESALGQAIIPRFFAAIRSAIDPPSSATTKTRLLFVEWRRLYGQVVGDGVQSELLRRLLRSQGEAHHQPYGDDPAAYLFALNTYIALVAKLVAAMSLPGASQNVTDSTVPLRARIAVLESGQLFADAGVSNMLNGDFFSWYYDDLHWREFVDAIQQLVGALGGISFDVTRKSSDSIRDLFKGMYQSFVPGALRHALGEYYTPDWLAAHALDQIAWLPENALLDPTCGSGIFLLEALRRRLAQEGSHDRSPTSLLMGIFGLDLNPLAIIVARASFVVYLSSRLDPLRPVRLPVFLADAINPAGPAGGIYEHALQLYEHSLQTELGPRTCRRPVSLLQRHDSFDLFGRLRELDDARVDAERIVTALQERFDLHDLDAQDVRVLAATIATLVDLKRQGWDGIWCSLLADRFAAGAIPPSTHICGNPPWVKWSHLPPEYAAFIKPRCLALGVFSQDVWVGGIESDISTVITYECIEKWLAPNGVLAFFITGTVFTNPSSQGFRRFKLRNAAISVRVERVEDFDAIAPFEGVSNHATLLVLRRDQETEYPVTYRVWRPAIIDGRPRRSFDTAAQFRALSTAVDLLAAPVPGTDAGEWLKGTLADHTAWQRIFGPAEPAYRARKGVTTDRNGVFVEVSARAEDGRTCLIRNDPAVGRTRGIPIVSMRVETEHLFPLLRGEGVTAFRATPDPRHRILAPQRGMHGDPDLPLSAPATYRFLARFEEELKRRSSLRRFQPRQVFWSLWSTGSYTFAAYKVLWREMGGGAFAAAYIGPYRDPILGARVVIPDHKLYFVPCSDEREAAYLTAVLNAPIIATAIASYAAQLSLGASVAEYLKLPKYVATDARHVHLADVAIAITQRGGRATAPELGTLDRLVRELFGVDAATLDGGSA